MNKCLNQHRSWFGQGVIMIDDPLTNSIIGSAIEVHNVLGNGFQACPEPVEGRLSTNGHWR